MTAITKIIPLKSVTDIEEGKFLVPFGGHTPGWIRQFHNADGVELLIAAMYGAQPPHDLSSILRNQFGVKRRFATWFWHTAPRDIYPINIIPFTFPVFEVIYPPAVTNLFMRAGSAWAAWSNVHANYDLELTWGFLDTLSITGTVLTE